jgi:hypothetical protein
MADKSSNGTYPVNLMAPAVPARLICVSTPRDCASYWSAITSTPAAPALASDRQSRPRSHGEYCHAALDRRV